MKKILIFGGAGFIGNQLTEKYLKAGHHVTVVDDCSNALEERIYVHQTYANYKFMGAKIENILEINFPHYSYDIIYHLASESRPLKFQEKYDKIVSANIFGLTELLVWMKRFSPNARLIYASTSEVYGENTRKLSEETPCIINTKYARNVYATAKMLAETMLQNEQDINWNIVRFFNVYGPNFRGDDTKIVPMLMKAIKYNHEFEICGNGNQTRSYTHIDDVIDGLVKLGDAKCKHEIFNLGTERDYSIEEIILFVLEYFALKYKHIPARAGEPVYRLSDSSKAKRILNWEAKKSFPEELIRLLNL